jgi:hypothetical protein
MTAQKRVREPNQTSQEILSIGIETYPLFSGNFSNERSNLELVVAILAT